MTYVWDYFFVNEFFYINYWFIAVRSGFHMMCKKLIQNTKLGWMNKPIFRTGSKTLKNILDSKTNVWIYCKPIFLWVVKYSKKKNLSTQWSRLNKATLLGSNNIDRIILLGNKQTNNKGDGYNGVTYRGCAIFNRDAICGPT